MSNYRRAAIKGSSYFFTVVTNQRNPVFNNEANVQILRDALHDEMNRRPFLLEAAVVLPDHLHCIWQLPEHDSDFSSRWREIKKAVTKRICTSRNIRNEGDIWQRRFWEHRLRDDHDWRIHMDYVHYNPVKHGYVSSAIEWPWSSFKHWVDRGAYDSQWGRSEPPDIAGLECE